MLTVFYDSYSVLMKVYSAGAYIFEAIAETPVEPIKKKQIYKICYGVLDRDGELSYYIRVLSPKTPKNAVRVVLKIAMYCEKYLGYKPYAVTTTAVELIKKLGKGGAAGFVNAFLRKFSETEFIFPTDKFEFLSVKYSYPEFAVKMLVDAYGESTAEKIISCDEEHTFARFSSAEEGKQFLSDNSVQYEETPFPALFDVKGLSADSDGFRSGRFTFQSVGSVAICEIAKTDGKVLDVCAAPGGKSVYLAESAESVTSCELHPHRAELIGAYAKRMGKTNIEVVCRDSREAEPSYVGKFDLVLCDVPCSGFGTVKRSPDLKLKKTADNIAALVVDQKKILFASASAVKAGGALVYSTCSVFKEENDDIISDFLASHDEFEVAEISSPLAGMKVKFGIQFLPHLSLGAGFYVSKLVKKK